MYITNSIFLFQILFQLLIFFLIEKMSAYNQRSVQQQQQHQLQVAAQVHQEDYPADFNKSIPPPAAYSNRAQMMESDQGMPGLNTLQDMANQVGEAIENNQNIDLFEPPQPLGLGAHSKGIRMSDQPPVSQGNRQQVGTYEQQPPLTQANRQPLGNNMDNNMCDRDRSPVTPGTPGIRQPFPIRKRLGKEVSSAALQKRRFNPYPNQVRIKYDIMFNKLIS